MTQTSNSLAGTVITAANGGFVWSGPANILLADSIYASASLDGEGDTSDFLIGKNFGFAVPYNSIITSVKISVCGYTDRLFDGDPAQMPVYVSLYNNGVIGSAYSVSVPDTNTEQQANRATGLNDGRSLVSYWGADLTPQIVNSANFGAAIYTLLDGSADVSPVNAYVDYIKVQVTYSAAARTLMLGAG